MIAQVFEERLIGAPADPFEDDPGRRRIRPGSGHGLRLILTRSVAVAAAMTGCPSCRTFGPWGWVFDQSRRFPYAFL